MRKLAADLGGERLDKFIALKEDDLSRTQIAGLMARGLVTVDGAVAKASYRLRGGELVEMTIPPPAPASLTPQDIPLTVVYEDDDVLVVDKPAGMVVHPAAGHPLGTLANALLARIPDLRGIGDEIRPGIVHRLDKDTSGLMMVAKSSQAHRHLSEQIKERAIRKGYLALVKGAVEPPEGIIRGSIGRDPRNRKRMALVERGRESETSYHVLERLHGYTLVEAFPRTGRTHQIRVHFSSLGHPLVGDSLYGGRDPHLDRQFLHAHILGFRLPRTGEYTELTSPLPGDLERCLAELRGEAISTPAPGARSNRQGGASVVNQ
ncbi:MAG: RluA family pseudouridine synthase [Chloroflexi bacterium]|nr:RluA family pseudouridine synthase [Chloroflexota bacterium]